MLLKILAVLKGLVKTKWGKTNIIEGLQMGLARMKTNPWTSLIMICVPLDLALS